MKPGELDRKVARLTAVARRMVELGEQVQSTLALAEDALKAHGGTREETAPEDLAGAPTRSDAHLEVTSK